MTISDDDFQGMVREFNLAVDAKPDVELRIKLIQEEADEFIKAIKAEDIIETIDALCDLAYVTYGAADLFNFQLDTKELSKVIKFPVPLTWGVLHGDQVLSDFNEAVKDTIVALDISQQIANVLKLIHPTTATEVFTIAHDLNKSRAKAALTDLIIGAWEYAADGLALDLGPFFREVHRTNMLKLTGPKREDGKQLKPEGWEPPRIKEMYEQLKSNKLEV